MFFNIDADTGGAITGWLIMDNPAAVPEFILDVPDRKQLNFKANVLRHDLLSLGVHATGLAGFSIDEQMIPDLGELGEFTLSEASTGLPIYRRYNSAIHQHLKFMFIEVAAFPQVKIMRTLMPHFALRYPFMERCTLDTTNAVIAHNFSNSIFATGQINWPRHGSFAREKGFLTAAMVRDPFEELAERLLFLTYIAKQSSSPPVGSTYSELLPLVTSTDLGDPRAILASFRKISPEQRRLLRSPMTALLGSTPDEDVQRRHVSVALDNLAQFDVVGTREQFRDFGVLADSLTGIDAFRSHQLEKLPGTDDLRARLHEVGLIADLLDEDIALYNFVNEAVRTGLQQQTERDLRVEVPPQAELV